MPITREFTTAELAALGVPPDDPHDIEYSDILADEPVTILKYTQLRRCVFYDDAGDTWAVEYEAPIDTGDFEVHGDTPDGNGWHGNTVTATQVEERQVTVTKWVPVGEGTGADA